jgi:hypothetical protein
MQKQWRHELFLLRNPVQCFVFIALMNHCSTGDRCYDLKNIFAEKFGKNGGYLLKMLLVFAKSGSYR